MRLRGKTKMVLGKCHLDNLTTVTVASAKVTDPASIPEGMPETTQEYLVRIIQLRLLPGKIKKTMRNGETGEDVYPIFRQDGGDNQELATLRQQLSDCRTAQPDGFTDPRRLLGMIDQWLDFMPTLATAAKEITAPPPREAYVAFVGDKPQPVSVEMGSHWMSGCVLRLPNGLQQVVTLPDLIQREGYETTLNDGTPVLIRQVDPWELSREDIERLERLVRKPLRQTSRMKDPGKAFIEELLGTPRLRQNANLLLESLNGQLPLAHA